MSKKKKEKENETKRELTLEETQKQRIERERARLSYSFSKVQPKKKRIITPLIERAAYMKIALEDMEEDLILYGFTEMFSQSEKQQEYERERPTAKIYSTMNANYQKIMKQLADSVEEPPPVVNNPSTGFVQFVGERDG